MTLDEAKRVQTYNLFVKKYAPGVLSDFKVYIQPESKENLGRWLLENGYFKAPASTKYHGAYEGGLFDHSLKVALRLVWLTRNLHLSWEYPESPVVVGLLHDICKIDKYIENPAENSAEPFIYNKTGLIYEGHGARSMALLQGHIMLSEEEAACIWYHMGAYETQMWDGYDAAIKRFPNVLYTHTADMLASKVDGV